MATDQHDLVEQLLCKLDASNKCDCADCLMAKYLEYDRQHFGGEPLEMNNNRYLCWSDELYFAVTEDNCDMVERLIQLVTGGVTGSICEVFIPPTYWAHTMRTGCSTCLRMLLTKRNCSVKTLHQLVANGNVKLVRCWFQAARFYGDPRDYGLRLDGTALHVALMEPNRRMIKYLIARTNPYIVARSTGLNALETAQDCSLECLGVMIKYLICQPELNQHWFNRAQKINSRIRFDAN